MEQLLATQNQILGVDDRNNWNELQSNFCSVIICVIRKLRAGIQLLADRIMTLSLQLIQAAGKTSTILEDASWSSALLLRLWKQTLATPNFARSLLASSVISPVLWARSSRYANMVMTITILSGLRDIAIGPAVEPFLDTTMSLEYDLMDFVGQLREGILEAYTGLVSGFKGTDKVSVLLPYVESILELVHRCYVDEEQTDAQMKLSFGLIGDLAESLAGSPQMKQMLLKPWIAQELQTKYWMPRERWSNFLHNR
ncbi:hypothetical protein B0H15DRAFT_988759 [Mycena belliarum]|uniref:Importin subunit beta-1/Transportin-1-like TPR repeats domain-containing protein n=1 Tax=Mycena belliarum TaxID=1033014 RepID=A0AAD6U231_9AGAR|nr:hypothetical protein B0H15DRAFT_988759 [Mycena belliae]